MNMWKNWLQASENQNQINVINYNNCLLSLICLKMNGLGRACLEHRGQIWDFKGSMLQKPPIPDCKEQEIPHLKCKIV